MYMNMYVCTCMRIVYILYLYLIAIHNYLTSTLSPGFFDFFRHLTMITTTTTAATNKQNTMAAAIIAIPTIAPVDNVAISAVDEERQMKNSAVNFPSLLSGHFTIADVPKTTRGCTSEISLHIR